MNSEEKQSVGIKIRNASLASIVLCLGLIFIALEAQKNGDLITAYILVLTSNIVTCVYLFGVRYYAKLLYGKQSQKEKDK